VIVLSFITITASQFLKAEFSAESLIWAEKIMVIRISITSPLSLLGDTLFAPADWHLVAGEIPNWNQEGHERRESLIEGSRIIRA